MAQSTRRGRDRRDDRCSSSRGRVRVPGLLVYQVPQAVVLVGRECVVPAVVISRHQPVCVDLCDQVAVPVVLICGLAQLARVAAGHAETFPESESVSLGLI